MITSSQQNVVKSYSKEGENNKRCIKVYILKSFLQLYQTVNEHSLKCSRNGFTERALKEKMRTQRALLGYSKVIWALGHLKSTWEIQEHLNNWALNALVHLGTRTLEVFGALKGTQALGHSRHLDSWALRHSKGTWTFSLLITLFLEVTCFTQLCILFKSYFLFIPGTQIGIFEGRRGFYKLGHKF